MIIDEDRNGGRASGKSFRSLLAAAFALSCGKRVSYYSATLRMSDYHAVRFSDLLASQRIQGVVRPNRLLFKLGEGVVKFLHPGSSQSGYTPHTSVVDIHYGEYLHLHYHYDIKERLMRAHGTTEGQNTWM